MKFSFNSSLLLFLIFNMSYSFDKFQMKFEATKTSDEYFEVFIDVGKKTYNLILDTSSSISTIKKIFNTYDNKIDHNEYALNYLNNIDITGHFHQENVNNDENYPIIFLLSPDFQYKGAYGILGMAYDEDEKNFLYKLKLNGNINKLIFSLKPLYGIYNKYEFYLGDYHNDFKLNETNKNDVGYCNMIHKRDSYSCMGKNILITNMDKVYNVPIDLKIVFDTASVYNYAPMYLMDQFQEAFKEECLGQTQIRNGRKVGFFKCRNVNKKMYLSFVINDFSYILSNHNLFTFDLYEEDHTLLNMILVFTDIDYILLGVPFIEQYHILFDLEDDKIFLHNDREHNGEDFITSYNENNNNSEKLKNSEIKYIYFIILCCVVLVVLNIFICKKKLYRNKSNNMLNENEEELLDI